MLFYGVRLEKAKEYLCLNGNKLLLYHRDGDGVTSASLLLRFFSGFETIPMEGPVIDKKMKRFILEKSPSLLCFTDIPIDQEHEKLKAILNVLPLTKVLIIDHHIPEMDMNSNNVIHINPRLKFKDLYMPASCIIYKMLKKMNFDVKMLVWISAAGIVSDYGMRDCMDIIEE
ncbi:MAG: hypothetical protein DRP03_03545, partial [Candidatus Aenigmatarchaeota archaeon]